MVAPKGPPRRPLLPMLLLLAAAAALAVAPLVRAAPPEDLSNFQNEMACVPGGDDPALSASSSSSTPPLIVRPKTLADVRQAVRSYTPVQAVGAGHSWNAPFFCPGAAAADADPTTTTNSTDGNSNGNSAAGIAMTAIRPLRIVVDEAAQTVTADAGVLVADLLDFLADYATPAAPAGYTLAAFPWFTFQTIGGAVATGTHGSSVLHGSLSQQLAAIDLVVSDGSTKRISEDEAPDPPLLMRAARISAGRLGVVARAVLRVVPEEPVRRELRLLSERDFLALLRQAQDAWNSAGAAREGTGLPSAPADPKGRRGALLARAKASLPRWALDGQAFWLPERRQFYLVTFQRASEAGCELFSPAKAAQAEQGGGEGMLVVESAAASSSDADKNKNKNKNKNNNNNNNNSPSCADFLSRYRPQATTHFDASRRAFSPSGHEPALPANGGGGDLLSLGDALRPSALEPSPPSQKQQQRYSSTSLPFPESLVALRALAERKLTSSGSDSGGGPRGVASPPPKRRLSASSSSGPYASSPDGTLLSVSGVNYVASNATLEASQSYIRQPERTLQALRQAVYSQYEVAIPLSTAADCLTELTRVVADESARTKARWGGAGSLIPPHNTTSTTGFFTAPLLRFVGPEDALLSYTGLDAGVALFINMEDYLYARNVVSENSNSSLGPTPDRNPSFKKAMAVLRGAPQCKGARLHLGKAGWPVQGCWRGDEEYGDRWCDFGCAVRALRAEEKFASAAPDRWTWAGVDLDACCGPDGFLGEKPGCVCRVAHARAKEDCPPAPFY